MTSSASRYGAGGVELFDLGSVEAGRRRFCPQNYRPTMFADSSETAGFRQRRRKTDRCLRFTGHAVPQEM